VSQVQFFLGSASILIAAFCYANWPNSELKLDVDLGNLAVGVGSVAVAIVAWWTAKQTAKGQSAAALSNVLSDQIFRASEGYVAIIKTLHDAHNLSGNQFFIAIRDGAPSETQEKLEMQFSDLARDLNVNRSRISMFVSEDNPHFKDISKLASSVFRSINNSRYQKEEYSEEQFRKDMFNLDYAATRTLNFEHRKIKILNSNATH
jgi:hypothetical protein